MEDYIMHPENLNIFSYNKKYGQWETRNHVPVAGEVCLVTDTGTLKIGDGIHSIEELPEISYTSDTKPIITERAKRIIEENIELIEQNEFNELYDKLFSDVQREVTVALLSAGIDIKTHLFPVPRAIRDILGVDKEAGGSFSRGLSSHATGNSTVATGYQSKWDQEVIDELRKQILTATQIPSKWVKWDYTTE